MLNLFRRQLPVAVTAAVVCILFTAGPAIARAAFDAVNADKVDGKHAVGFNASVMERAGKLVATNSSTGLLPNDIISSAPDADKLDGQDSATYRVAARGMRGSLVNIDSCGSGVVVSYVMNLTQRSHIFAAATSTYGRSSPGPERPTVRVQLLDSNDMIVAQTGRVVADSTGGGNPSLTVAGVLLNNAGTGAYDASAGRYTLRLWADQFGACTGFGQYQQPELSHLVMAAGGR